MTTTATSVLRRRGAGSYESWDGFYTIVHNPAGWVFYVTDDPLSADRCDTLGEVRDYVRVNRPR